MTRSRAARAALLFALVLGSASPASHARGGGGCVAAGTLVATPDGDRPVEQLVSGDSVWAVVGGRRVAARVEAVREVCPEKLIELELDGARLVLTADHPVARRAGVFVRAGNLVCGDVVWAVRDSGFDAATVRALCVVPAGARRAYDLVVAPGGTFVAGGVVVHNKGCFLPDTPVTLYDRTTVAISRIARGDRVLAFDERERALPAVVREVLVHEVEAHLVVDVGGIQLAVTPEHPFYVGAGEFRDIEALGVGDLVRVWTGERLEARAIASVRRVEGKVRVYNLQVDHPHTYFAHGVAVHNKGGGGGCIAEGTRVETPTGERAIEDLVPGDAVWAVVGGARVHAQVLAIHETHPAELLEIEAGNARLCATKDHPIARANGVYVRAGGIACGDVVWTTRGGGFGAAAVRAVRALDTGARAYDLVVAPGGTFIAGGVVVHNKGCFLPDTPVTRYDGSTVAISRIVPGDRVLAFDEHERALPAVVRAVYVHAVESYLVVDAGGIELRVTPEHPFYVGGGEFRSIDSLGVGDLVRVWTGERLEARAIVSVRRVQAHARVYNLVADHPHTYFAHGVAVHNKGGGGGHRSGGSSRSSSSRSTGGRGASSGEAIAVVLFVGVVVVVGLVAANAVAGTVTKSTLELDYLHPTTRIEAKARRTEALLAHLARLDPSLAVEPLRAHVKATFVRLQQCWQARDNAPMKPLMMPDLHREHAGQLAAMVRSGEVNMLEGLSVERVDFVGLHYGTRAGDRTVTVLFTAKVRDYYVSDRTKQFQRGDKSPGRFQEFWTFLRHDGAWRLSEIEQAGESASLSREDFVESMTDDQIEAAVGEAAQGAGAAAAGGAAAGPMLPAAVKTKHDKIERALNHLVQLEKHWDRRAMLQAARGAFLEVFLARQQWPLPPLGHVLAADALASLTEQMATANTAGISVDYRNLCVRKADIVHLDNKAGKHADAFTARIAAHAQKIVSKGGRVIRQDADVVAWTEYWTFVRDGDRWKLGKVQAPAQGEAQVARENVDEDSGEHLLQWYYTKKRAM